MQNARNGPGSKTTSFIARATRVLQNKVGHERIPIENTCSYSRERDIVLPSSLQ